MAVDAYGEIAGTEYLEDFEEICSDLRDIVREFYSEEDLANGLGYPEIEALEKPMRGSRIAAFSLDPAPRNDPVKSMVEDTLEGGISQLLEEPVSRLDRVSTGITGEKAYYAVYLDS